MAEARELYNKLQNGQHSGNKILRKLDVMELKGEDLASDPDTPDECVISTQAKVKSCLIDPGMLYNIIHSLTVSNTLFKINWWYLYTSDAQRANL